jgi:flagellar protein FliS
MVAQDCARAYRANAILTASPGQLVLLLYDGALNAIAMARQAFDQPSRDFRRYETINRQLTKARRIIAQLKSTLNFEVGGEFAQTMDRLYHYYDRRLLEGNLRKQVDPIVEVEKLLGEVRDAWAKMLTQQAAPREIAELAPDRFR